MCTFSCEKLSKEALIFLLARESGYQYTVPTNKDFGGFMEYYRIENNREDLLSLLDERRILLCKLLKELEKKQQPHPGGMVKAIPHKKSFQYYWKKHSGAPWEYIPKSERGKAEKIINCEYLEKIRAQITREIELLNRISKQSFPKCMEEIYSEHSAGRKALIHRVVPSGEEFIQNFLSEEYESMENFSENKQYETGKGELVRSKSELMIAEALIKHGIPYHYEYPIRLKGYGVAYTDFRCLNVHRREIILWEHLGRMGDESYADAAIHKVHAYEENGFIRGKNFIITEESAGCPLTPTVINRWIKMMLL